METLNVDERIKTYVEEILSDFKLVCESREASLLGRKEVLTGKAKFGIFGDGKELAQIAMAKSFKDGDWRSGYYRDQTFMMAIGALDVQQFFAGLYAHPDIEKEPFSAGRQMGGHFSTTTVGHDGLLDDLTSKKNSSADISPTAGQMPRLLGLALASKLFRNNQGLGRFEHLSVQGNEVAFGTIGDASTSEGLFWETMNAAGVLQVPLVMSVWDDGYGISVSKDLQTVKESISEALSGFQRTDDKAGFEIMTVKGWDYPALLKTYEAASALAREQHVPVLIHVTEVTQPQGHSTSGSHERYKSAERLEWETQFDCVEQFKQWILSFRYDGEPIATEEQLDDIRKASKKEVRRLQKEAWKSYTDSIKQELQDAIELLDKVASESSRAGEVSSIREGLLNTMDPIRKDVVHAVRKVLQLTAGEQSSSREAVNSWYQSQAGLNQKRYSSHLLTEDGYASTAVQPVTAETDEGEMVDGRIILRENFKEQFSRNPLLVTFGEDTGKIGGVNQSMEGMQELFGEERVMDTGIREATIIGQGIGMAMRGLRPLAEIQYLDYLFYALQIMSDDLATVRYRTFGQQMAPLIVRTRGHRLEGIWHSGSPMGAVIHSLRGIVVCVPRNMTKAAGMFNTLMEAHDPALIVEPLNGYRTKEPSVKNLGDFREPIGQVDLVREGTDVTVLSYGSTFNMCREAVDVLEKRGIDVELIDAQTLLPFDIVSRCAKSIEKTNALVIVDEDVPGGASAYLLDDILTRQKAFFHLDSEPVTLTAKAHRPAYSSDGDYFSKPSVDDIYEAVYGLMTERDPVTFPAI